MSLRPTRPPGLNTRANSRAAFGLSGNVQNAHSQTTASIVESSIGNCSASSTWLVERPGIHEVLRHDHQHVIGEVSDRHGVRKTARLAGQRQLIERLLRSRDRR
jgi:hypothetical protein